MRCEDRSGLVVDRLRPVEGQPRGLVVVSQPSGRETDDAARFRELRRTGDRRLRDDLIDEHLGLATAMAQRYEGRGVPLDDLVQVATIGLLKAVVRYDPDRGPAFSSYAVPTILGELRHHFRDHGWTVSVPRRLQDLRRRADSTAARLAQERGHQPTVTEVADDLGEDRDTVLLALDGLRTAYAPGTLDTGTIESLASGAAPQERAEDRVLVRRLLATLPERERRVVVLRYWGGLSQQQIADRVGCSQMHVSRLLRRSLAAMQDRAATGAHP